MGLPKPSIGSRRRAARWFSRHALPLLLVVATALSTAAEAGGGARPLPGAKAMAADGRAPKFAHECDLFAYHFVNGEAVFLATLAEGLLGQVSTRGDRRSNDDGWAFGYFLAPPLENITRPIILRRGARGIFDLARWDAAVAEVQNHGLATAASVVGHVRNSSFGPDAGALPDPHPFADSLAGRWWLFAHNGTVAPDSLLQWIDRAFLDAHPLDYAPLYVDSELLFRFALDMISRYGNVQRGLLAAFDRVERSGGLFNLCLTDGDTLWTAHSFHQVPFRYGARADSTAWWVATYAAAEPSAQMELNRLYWFAPGSVGSRGY